jgi:hypothetical protein
MDEKQDGLVVEQQKQVNGVAYESLPETTIAVSRTHERQFFQKDTYSPANNEAICDWNTGAKHVNARRGYLTFVVKSDQGTITSLGRGSAMNFIRRVVITSRSGTELSRTEDYNVLMAKELRYNCSKDYLDSWGELIGFKEDGGVLPTAIDSATGVRFIIPLELVSPFFMGDGKTMIPPQAAAGLRVQLTFADAAQAIKTAVTATTYTIEGISFHLSTTMMVDSWQRQLAMESARDGLTYSYPEWHTSQSSTSGTGLSIEVRKAVARALSAYVVTTVEGANIAKDNMASAQWKVASYEWRLGSMYPTQQPVKNVEESYFIAQSMVDGGVLDCKRPNVVNLSGFTGSASDNGDGIIAVNLERNDVMLNGSLNIGGLPTNNSRVLALNATFVAANPGPELARTHYVFMKHLRVAKFYQDNAVLAE